MADTQHLDLITERVERLLLRYEELQRTNTLLREQVLALQAERDLLRSRMQVARSRVDALLDRLPVHHPPTESPTPSVRQEPA